jgi:hypothetical protein
MSTQDDLPIVSVNIMGGLGNQMFQLASAYAYSRIYNGKFIVEKNKRSDDGRPLYWDSILNNFNKYLVDTIPTNLEQWREIQATEFSLIPPLTSKGLYINGYLQSSKYFGNEIIKNEIKDLFKPNDELMKIINTKYNFLMENKERVVVVHARRTDYLKNDYIINFHGPLTSNYYKEAINRVCEVVKNPIFLLSSDDNNFWFEIFKEIPQFYNNPLFILNNENDINSLILLQQFNHFIVANSTFSWWAAWLSKDPKMVIAPSKWFGPYGPRLYEDIYEKDWIRI